MKKKPVFDVVVPFAGRFDCLDMCLNAIYKYATLPITLTIVDDASLKESRNQNIKLFSYQKEKDVNNNIVEFRSKRNETQQGFIKTANSGASGKAPYVVFITDDVEIHEGYFDKILDVFENNVDGGRKVGVVGSKLLFPPTSTHPARPAGKIQHIGVALDVRANAVHPLVGWSPENPKTQISRECFAVTGALYAIRRDLWHRFGGFDPIYGMGYWEDIDLCLKVRQAGYRIWMSSEASAYHYVAATSETGRVHNSGFQVNAMMFKSRWAGSGLFTYDVWSYG